MFDQVEVRPIRAAQAEAPPAQQDDAIGLVGALLAEALQARRSGVVAVADPHLACDRRTALDRLGAMPVVRSRCEKPPRPRSYTACTRQSVPFLPRLLMQVPSAARRIRPAQRTLAPADFASNWQLSTA